MGEILIQDPNNIAAKQEVVKCIGPVCFALHLLCHLTKSTLNFMIRWKKWEFYKMCMTESENGPRASAQVQQLRPRKTRSRCLMLGYSISFSFSFIHAVRNCDSASTNRSTCIVEITTEEEDSCGRRWWFLISAAVVICWSKHQNKGYAHFYYTILKKNEISRR